MSYDFLSGALTMPRNDPNDLLPPIKYKIRHVLRPLTDAEIKAAADRAEARSMLTATRTNDDPNSGASNAGGVDQKSPAFTGMIET